MSIASLVARLFGLRTRAQENAEARQWLGELRENELSVAARRRIAPDEPVHAPRVGHGASDALPAPMPSMPEGACTPNAAASGAADGADYVSAGIDSAVRRAMSFDAAPAGEWTAAGGGDSGGGDFGGGGSSGSFDISSGDSDSGGGDSGGGGDD